MPRNYDGCDSMRDITVFEVAVYSDPAKAALFSKDQ